MKKTTKLLSVLLAVVMMMSCFTMAAFAAKAQYQTGAQLNTLGAYSPDGAVTRLSTEERMSIVFDWLDTVLYNVDFEGIHVNQSVLITTIKLDITINSVDEICASLDSAKNVLEGAVASIGSGLGLLGDLGDLTLKSWTANARRANTDQLVLVQRLLNILNDNSGLVDKVLANGKLNLGSIIGGMVNLAKVNKILANLPGFILSKLYPLMSRKDDTKAVADQYYNGTGAPSTVLNTFVNNLFQKPQSTTTYKEDASGNCISGHSLPTAASSNLRYYYVKTAASGTTPAYYTAMVWDSNAQKYTAEEAKFYREEEVDGSGVYVYKTSAGDALKYYKPGSYWLPSFVGQSVNINNESVASIFYKFIPYVFGDLAPIALNGWAKHALATWMGATETKIYQGDGSDASAVLADLPAEAQALFTADVPYYQFSYSSYLAYNDDVNYYRWVDKDTGVEEWFELDMTTGNYFLGLFDFSYVVTADFMNEFVPASGTATKTLFQSLNDFLCKAASLVLKDDVYNSLGLQTGDNAYLVSNLRKAAQALLPESPDAILGPDYLHHYDGYYQTLVDTNATNDEVFSALAAIIAKALMPQLILPSAENLAGQKVGAVLACVVRELVTQMVPTYNYDALIFTDYNTRTLVSGKDNSYWLDVILTMGVDVGMSYLSNLTDLGADDTSGYVFNEAGKTYDLATFEANPQAWEATVDWIIDWALTTDKEWAWNMQNLLDVSGLTINRSTAQDPWVKLDKILNDLLPLKQILNCTAASGKTWTETVLRDKLILGIADLQFENIFGKGTDYTASGNAGLLSIPSTSVLRTAGTNTGALSQLILVVRDLLNKVLYKVLSVNLFDTSVFKASSATGAIDTLNSQTNLRKPVNVLLTKLPTAYNRNLLQTVLPILNMFVGWKTGSQEYVDPELKWSSSYLYNTDASQLTITNKSAGMLLKNFKPNGTFSYESAYNVIIDNISGSGLTINLQSGYSTTIAPYGRAIYDIKSSTAPTADKATQLIIKYHVTGKSGATLGGSRYIVTYVAQSKNQSDIVQAPYTNDYNKSSGGTSSVDYLKQDAEISQNALCMSRDELENVLATNIVAKAKNTSDTYGFKISSMSFTPSNAVWLKTSGEVAAAVNKTVAAGDELAVHPVVLSKTADQYVSGANYGIGTIKWNATSTGGNYSNGPTDGVDMGKLYFADAGELSSLYNSELAKNRVSDEYNTVSLYNAYTTAMKNAAVLLNAPAMASTFATTYADSNIQAKLTALQSAVEALDDDAKPASGNEAILENGLTAGEAGAAIGADGQINFQDYKLYGYWLYEKNRTTARNVLSEYNGPVAPQAYIEGCWLPYTDAEKSEDLSTVIAAESNATKKAAIEYTLVQPDAKDVAAYELAVSEWKAPGYSALYVADIADKLEYYNDFLKPRSYSTVAAGRAQLAQEIAFAAAQNYNEADYTAKSWARYQDALTAANAANVDGTMQSFVFKAKYDLLKAQRDLRLAAYDYETQVGYEGLQALMDLAEGMFQNAEYFTAVDGTLDTEWADLVKALGYTANFGSGDDAWSMNLYSGSAQQLITEELDTRSPRNEERVEKVTAALQAAIDALKCTIEVVKNDDTTVVDQEIKYITNIAPLALTGVDAVLAHVKATSAAATLTVTATANGFGTGTVVAATLNNIPLVNYFVVIYGDVNGDNAIDGFDAAKADSKLTSGASFTAPQEKAADATKDGVFEVSDVSAIISAASGNTDISQA